MYKLLWILILRASFVDLNYYAHTDIRWSSTGITDCVSRTLLNQEVMMILKDIWTLGKESAGLINHKQVQWNGFGSIFSFLG